MPRSNGGLNSSTRTRMGDLELAVIAKDDTLIMEDSTLDLSSMISDLNLAPIPWNDPMLYISVIIIVAFSVNIIYNLWTREYIS